jgi:hypothetical protein
MGLAGYGRFLTFLSVNRLRNISGLDNPLIYVEVLTRQVVGQYMQGR